jgi:transposase-like protein
MPSDVTPVNAPARRTWPLAEKRRIVELTLQPGISVQTVAQKYKLDPPTLSSWRTLYRQGLLDGSSHKMKTEIGSSKFLPINIQTTSVMKNSQSAVVTMQMPNGITLKIEADIIDFSGLASCLAEIYRSI